MSIKIPYQFSFKYFEAKNIEQTVKSSKVYMHFTYLTWLWWVLFPPQWPTPVSRNR